MNQHIQFVLLYLVLFDAVNTLSIEYFYVFIIQSLNGRSRI